MTDSPLPRSDAASRFFDNYLAALHRLHVPEKQQRWYVKHVEDFIKAQNGRRIKTFSGPEMGAYLDVPSRRPGLRGWQFGQRVGAIRILFCGLVDSGVCRDGQTAIELFSTACFGFDAASRFLITIRSARRGLASRTAAALIGEARRGRDYSGVGLDCYNDAASFSQLRESSGLKPMDSRIRGNDGIYDRWPVFLTPLYLVV